MPDTVILQATVDVELDRRLEKMAAEHEMSKDELVADILRYSLLSAMDYEAFIEEGLSAAREGRLIDHAEVGAEIERMIAEG